MKQQLDTEVGDTTATDNIGALLLQSQTTWDIIAQYIKEVLRNKMGGTNKGISIIRKINMQKEGEDTE